ncbi:hypothetical protein D9M72_616390 [compost metagenome]
MAKSRGVDEKGTIASQTAASDATVKPAAHHSAARRCRLFTAMVRNATVKICAMIKFTASREIAPPIEEPETFVLRLAAFRHLRWSRRPILIGRCEELINPFGG